MTSRVASAILTRTSSMRRTTLPGLRKSIQATFGGDGSYEMNDYIHKDFFEGENYQSILKCLDDGYEISSDLIDYMQDYCKLLQDFVENLTSYTKRWKSKIKHQSTLSSYNTTKQVQLQTIGSALKLAELIEIRCKAIQEVIATYKRQTDRMYPKERFGATHKHYRTDVMKKSFKSAYSPLSKASDKLEKLREQEKKAQDALLQAQIEVQNLELSETANKNKLFKANDRQEQRQAELQEAKEKVTRAQDEYHQEQKTYRDKATEIYNECRDLEAERLNQIRDTIIAFNKAIHSTEYSAEQDTMYEKVLTTIQSDQNTLADLDFWAQTYHVNILSRSISLEKSDNEENSESRKTRKSHKNETTALTTISENTAQPVAETEEDQSAADKPTSTQAKGKQRKKKTNSTEPPTPE